MSSFTNTEEYQQRVRDEYSKRNPKVQAAEVPSLIAALGIPGARAADIEQITYGNINATFSCRDLIVKINDRPEQRMLPNKVVSDLFADTPDARVVRVLAYDWHQRTPHEMLVMCRADGANLLAHAIDMPEAQLRSIFRQTCRLVARLHRIEFDTFGEINEVGAGGPNPSFATCPEFLLAEFEANVAKIKSGRLADPDDMERIEHYFREHVSVFSNERPVLVHNDEHFGNVLFTGDQLSSLIDWDSTLRGPAAQSLVMLLLMIDQPQCVVEGKPLFERYRGRQFYALLPDLKEELSNLFADRALLRKLNLLNIGEQLFWVGDAWSAQFGEELVANILSNELAEDDDSLQNTYAGRIINHKQD